jgi:hypothetical protein
MAYENIREEELKNKIAQDYFGMFDCTKIIGNVDFCVTLSTENKKQTQLLETESLLWAEAKKGKSDIFKSIVQLILTIGKARTFDKNMPPAYLGAFDAEKIAFIPYNDIHDIFYQNDFNWNVTPSNYETKEFKQVYEKVKTTIENKSLLFYFDKDSKDLHEFVKINFILGKSSTSKIQIDKSNFMVIYSKWLLAVKPTVAVNWDIAQKNGIIDGDFYLADLLSEENETLKDKLYVLLKKDHYQLDRKIDEAGMFSSKTTSFTDNQKAHQQFWNKYERPPKEDYWDYIVERRDLLVPQDVRERKGSFFTPQIWVELSQKYLTDVLGKDWQDEYYIWDCACGTGNLLAGLTNKYNIWASTLDTQDVDVIRDRIKNGANLLESHVFQFDFLNDDFTKLPQPLQDIINNPEKRKKLVMYINPPYAEASNKRTLGGGIEGNRGVEQNKTNKKYAHLLGQGNAELFVQFLTRIYAEIPNCFIAQFSKLKIINGPHFGNFRKFFKANLLKSFICPANTFDNVKGLFPIGFMIWDTKNKAILEHITTDVYDKEGKNVGNKTYYTHDTERYINDWIKPFRANISQNQLIGKFPFKGSDFQNQNMIQLVHHKMDYNTEAGQFFINQKNVVQACVYIAVRKCIEATWLNDRDQFLYPNDGWQTDTWFQSDCLVYTLFTNNIQSQYGTNHWIPFTEQEVNAREKMDSNFMAKYIAGKIDTNITFDLFYTAEKSLQKEIIFGNEAKEVFDAGRELWRYYHAQPNCNVNASLYDIREFFQGRNEAGKMNNKSTDETYSKLIADLRASLKTLANKIAPKVYEYGFLKA